MKVVVVVVVIIIIIIIIIIITIKVRVTYCFRLCFIILSIFILPEITHTKQQPTQTPKKLNQLPANDINYAPGTPSQQSSVCMLI